MDDDALERVFQSAGRNPLFDACPGCGRAGMYKVPIGHLRKMWLRLRRKPTPCADPFHWPS